MTGNTVLVVAAHPDDEVLGCGGTIARHVASGDEVHILIIAEGATSRGDSRDNSKFTDYLDELRNSAKESARILGTNVIEFLGMPDNRLDSAVLLDIIKPVEEYVKKVKPHTIYTHSGKDLNIDHKLVNAAVTTACRPQPGQTVRELFYFEVPSSTEWSSPEQGNQFIPCCYVDITEHLATKIRALECYAQEMRPWPHARSTRAVEHLARWRGASVGVEAAEAFQVCRIVR